MGMNLGDLKKKNSLCHRGRIYSKSKNQGNTEMTNALSPVDSDFGITIRNRTLKIYSVILIAFELSKTVYSYPNRKSCRILTEVSVWIQLTSLLQSLKNIFHKVLPVHQQTIIWTFTNYKYRLDSIVLIWLWLPIFVTFSRIFPFVNGILNDPPII